MKKPQCPRCKSFKTYDASKSLMLLAVGAISGFIGIFFAPLLIIAVPCFLIGLISLILTTIKRAWSKKPFKEEYKCKECGEKFSKWKKVERKGLINVIVDLPDSEIPKQ